MIAIKVNKKEYKVVFGYRALAKSGVLKEVDKISAMFDGAESENLEMISDVLDILAKLVLAGLQKHHNEFYCEYDTKSEIDSKLNLVYDLFDDYFAQEDVESPLELFTTITNELVNEGFFKSLSAQTKQQMEQTDATVVPKGHLKAVAKN